MQISGANKLTEVPFIECQHAQIKHVFYLYLQCTSSLLDESAYIKDAIAKLTVEIMKREWPQNWPDVIQSLSEISQKGVKYIS